MKRIVTVILNGGIRKSKSNYYISSKDDMFLYELSTFKNIKIIVSDSLSASSQNFYDCRLRKEFGTRIFGNVPSVKHLKIFYYIKIFLLNALEKKEAFIYVFFPGNLSYSILMALFIRRREYGLYLRGEVRYKNFLLNYFARKILRNAKFIIATGRNTADFAKKYNKNVEEVVPMMSVSKKDLYLRENYSLSKPIRILFLSRIEKDKGIYEAVEAVKSIINEGYDVQFDIAGGGSGDMMEKLKESISPIKDRTNVLGQISDNEKIKELFRKADIYIFPSYHEGFPRVLYEAMTFSTPIITTNISGTDGVMIENRNCLKVSPKSSVQVRDGIIKLINDEDLRKKIGLNGYDFMEDFFKKINNNSHAKQVLNNMEKK